MQPKDKITYVDPDNEYNKNFAYEVIWVDEILVVESLPNDPKSGVLYQVGDTQYTWSGTEWLKIGGDTIIELVNGQIEGDTLIIGGE